MENRTKPDTIILMDIETKQHLDANDAALKLYGYNRDEFLSLRFADISIEPEETIERIGNRKTDKDLIVPLHYHRKKNGTIFPVEISVSFFELGDRKTLCAVIRDITGRKRIEDELKQDRDCLDLIVNNLNGFIYTVSKNYTIEFMNNALIDHIGYDATGEDCFQIIHGLNEKCAWCVGDRVFSGESAHFEYKSPKDNRWYYYISTPRFNLDDKVTAQQFIAIDLHERKQKDENLKKSKNHLQQQDILLKSASINRYGLDNIVGQSLQMQDIYSLILEVASSDAGVLIYGESGTGKELVANAIHNLGEKKDNAFLPVNCGGIPGSLVESEFFGYKKGAFTGANIDKSGFLEIADGGTLFLDEIGEISLNMQVKLLRALDGDGYTPLGSSMPIKPDIRIIAATNKDLNALVKKGLMRSDFYYRINIIPIHLPPLRKRKEDIPFLIYHFLRRFSPDKTLPHIVPKIMNALENYDWPGNVRELQNIIHRYVTLKRLDVFDSFLTKEDGNDLILEFDSNVSDQTLSLRDSIQYYEKKVIAHHLKKNQWKQGRVASILRVNRKTLYYKIKKYGIGKI
jgi:PAS domain S-box-containing protein